MEVFLKLPKEILSLIFSNIKDRSTIKSLLYIPGLQHIALERKYPKYEINNYKNSIETLINLHQQFKFIPSTIIGNVKQINQLINEPNFRLVNYEVKILKTTRFTDLVSISDKVYIVGVHLNQYLEPFVGYFKKDEIKSFLSFVESTFLQSLTTSHLNIFTVSFPKSLKQLTLNEGYNIELNISELHHLESFDCKYLHKMSTLDNLQLPLSIKNLALYSCDFKTLGDLSKYYNLKLLHISCCPELYDLGVTSFPDSLKTFNFVNNFHPGKINKLLDEERFDYIASRQVHIDGRFRFPRNLKNLKICDTMQSLEVGDIMVIRKTLDILELNSIGHLELDELLVSLPKKMSEIIITNCRVVAEGHVDFPESERIKFTNNDVWFNCLDSNLNQLKSLKVLDMSNNYCSCGSGLYLLDPLEILANVKENVCFDTPNLQNLILKKSRFDGYDPYERILSFQVSFKCENLTKLKMLNLRVKSLDFDHFPNSLEELIINNLKLENVQGNIYKFDNLKKLDLQNNQITYSMLSSQEFPFCLTHLNLSNNNIENLNCLSLYKCINLKDLNLREVTSKDKPRGASRLRKLLLNLDTNIDAILTNYDLDVIFEIVNGVEKNSIFKSIYKKRRIG
ncbi:uncharacterized protein KGF55_000640 [Candida pseudojiufengensis]|uniref:uncharacterized protein n=1 Tax=Candida pseudojiufengensis TaxID=497109 RepID=UPI00222473D0|nr:uncharacterized protein KGF55_000640 [Candida pseudojiufengensis]KAI5966331.1 hypothetical protein KGF55_000640 [Candida pseudojiufengensis]